MIFNLVWGKIQSMIQDKIIISIGGGQVTGVRETALQIQENLHQLFPYIKVSVIDLDEMANIESKKYTDKDYDFNAVYDTLITKPKHESLEIVLLCGSYALYDANINNLSKLKVFLDSEGDKRLINMIRSKNVNTPERLDSCITEYLDHLRPEMNKYIEPTRAHADVIIPSSNESIGSAIIVDGVVKIIEDKKGGIDHKRKLFPQLDFQLERLNVEKDRYYDLS